MKSSLKKYLLLWSIFFLICFGLGYPTLGRYDPRRVEGLSDTINYYQTVMGQPSGHYRADIFRCRLLVPFIARPFYLFARSYLKTWEPVFFGLLIANSLFCATSACLLVNIGQRLTKESSTALLAATLYLLSFAVPNLQLSGLIDASESFMMLALAWTLLRDRWWLLPLWGLLGPLAKETFVPFSAVFMIAWWITAERQRGLRSIKLRWMAATIILSVATFLMVRLLVLGAIVWPWNVAAQMNARTNLLASFWRCFSNHNFWYVFIWLLPLGLPRLRQLPRAWVMASILTGALALAFGALNDMQGTVARPLFNITGPLLSLSAALFLTGLFKGSGDVVETENISRMGES